MVQFRISDKGRRVQGVEVRDSIDPQHHGLARR